VEFTSEDAKYARKVLTGGIGASDVKHRVRFTAYGENPTHHVSLPAQIMRQMVSAIRGAGEDKPFPSTFMGGRVIMAARIPVGPGLAPHQALIIREYEEDGTTLYSVHYLIAQATTEQWSGDMGAYGIDSREKAFDEFSERMHQRGKLSRSR
jgi:hypothetical protein